jgi:glycosyltransferase involved in cell wall biosynthesis
MAPLKVVVIGTRGIPRIQGGVERHCEELYPRLVQRGCAVTVVRRSCYVEEDNRLSEYRGVKLHDLYAPRKKSLEAIVHSFLAVCYARRVGADVLHCHAIGPSIVVPFARLLGLKVVMTHHGPDYDRKKWGALARFVLRLGERLGVKYANRVIVISEVIRTLVKEKYGRTDAALIYNGVPAPRFVSATTYVHSLGLEPRRYVLALGRFVEEKGFDLLVRAFAAWQRQAGTQGEGAAYHLVLAGTADHEDAYSARLRQLAQEHGVVLTGFIRGEKLDELMTHAALFVLPSFHEGLPISLLEAMSYNLPVLVSDIPANREVGLPAADYFPCGDERALEEALAAKLSGGELGRCTYDMSRYDWDYIAGQVCQLYHNL